MSKKNKNKNSVAPITPETSAPVAPVVPVAPVATGLTQDEETKLTELQAQIEQLKAAKIEREKQAQEKLKADLNALPAQFNQPDMDSMIKLLKRHMKGSNPSKPRTNSGRGHIIPDDVKKAAEADIKANKDTIKVIAERHGVSAPWVQGRRKAMGLVVSRAAA